MSVEVEHVNKWAYFAQNLGWMISIPVALTLIYSNLSNRVDAQEKEISQIRTDVGSISTKIDSISDKQVDQKILLMEVKALLDNKATITTTTTKVQPTSGG